MGLDHKSGQDIVERSGIRKKRTIYQYVTRISPGLGAPVAGVMIKACLCKRMIDPHNYQRNDLSDFLQKHHIVFFSNGGENTVDNLLLLCSSCHSMVHARPVDFPIETLRSRKAEWIALADIISSDDSLKLLEGTNAAILAAEADGKIPAIFSVESLNLTYSIWAPCDIRYTISQLAEVAFSRILKPLAQATNNQSWLFADEMDLAYRSSPSDSLPRDGPVRHYVCGEDPFIGLIRTRSVPAALRPFDLQRFGVELGAASI